MGAFRVLAEIDESHPVFEALRRTGFSTYGWQQVWAVPMPGILGSPDTISWEESDFIPESTIRTLIQSLLPPLVNSTEFLQPGHHAGWVFRRKGEMLAYVEAITGMQGIFLMPVFHPDTPEPAELLRDLLHRIPAFGRPVYIALYSFQGWMQSVLEELNARPGPRQAMLVRHLTGVQRVLAGAGQKVRSGEQVQPTASMAERDQ